MLEKYMTALDVWRVIVRKIKCYFIFNYLFSSYIGNLIRGGKRGLGVLVGVII